MHAGVPIDLSPLGTARGGVVVAFSGGLDSTVLLHRLASLPEVRARGLRALHVNHGLHADAERWQVHCKQACARLGVPLDCVRVQVSACGDGPESAARRARHGAFEAALGAGDVLAVAHHRDDQAETFLLRALRASGPDGLGAMRVLRPLGHGLLWRPLLATPRDALRAYAQAHGLTWVDDPGNADTTLDRNFLRHELMPLLRRRWAHADSSLARAAALSAQAAALLEAEDEDALSRAGAGAPDTLDVAALLALEPARRARALRRWVAGLGLPPLPAEGLRRIEADLLHAAPDAEAQFRWGVARVRRWRGVLHAGRAVVGWQLPIPLPWSGTTPLRLPLGDRLELSVPAGFPWPVTVRERRGGERILLAGRSHRHQLKHLLQERDMPPWERERLPLLVDAQDELLAAGDAVVSGRLEAWLATSGTRLLWHRQGGRQYRALH